MKAQLDVLLMYIDLSQSEHYCTTLDIVASDIFFVLGYLSIP